MEKIIGFHATDKALADSIIANGFSFSRAKNTGSATAYTSSRTQTSPFGGATTQQTNSE